MKRYLGYSLMSLPFLIILFIGFIIPGMDWWLGFLAYAIAGILVGVITLGIKLLD